MGECTELHGSEKCQLWELCVTQPWRKAIKTALEAPKHRAGGTGIGTRVTPRDARALLYTLLFEAAHEGRNTRAVLRDTSEGHGGALRAAPPLPPRHSAAQPGRHTAGLRAAPPHHGGPAPSARAGRWDGRRGRAPLPPGRAGPCGGAGPQLGPGRGEGSAGRGRRGAVSAWGHWFPRTAAPRPHAWVLLRSGIDRGDKANPTNGRLEAFGSRVARSSSAAMAASPVVTSKRRQEAVRGVRTEVVCTAFSNAVLVVVTQYGKMGTLVYVDPDTVGDNVGRPSLSTKVLLGKDEVGAAARRRGTEGRGSAVGGAVRAARGPTRESPPLSGVCAAVKWV